jgi:hypothetical protein
MTQESFALSPMNDGSEGLICRKRPLWAELIFVLDQWLQCWQGVFEYTQKQNCIFRVAFGKLNNQIVLSDGTLGFPGDRVIDLHFWNEHIPATPIQGRSLAWGCRFKRHLTRSLRELAGFLMK